MGRAGPPIYESRCCASLAGLPCSYLQYLRAETPSGGEVGQRDGTMPFCQPFAVAADNKRHVRIRRFGNCSSCCSRR